MSPARSRHPPRHSRTAATYVFCVVAADRPPRVGQARGLPGMGSVRLLDLAPGLWAAVADAPIPRYGEAAIARGLSDLDWVSRAAVAHERVVESFADASAVLPMKLFTIFAGDARAQAHLRERRRRIATLVALVKNQREWGVRLVLDRARVAAAAPASTKGLRSGAAYLARRKAQRDAAHDIAERARDAAEAVYARLAGRARRAKRRAAAELPDQGGPLLLDAAFLVPRAKETAFRSLVARQARTLARQGFGLRLTGPWPPYSFVQD